MDAPIIKGTSGILFLSETIAKDFEEQKCIRCAKCVDVCPMRLLPTEIVKDITMENWAKAESLYISDCMECGACSYECPSRIPLVQYIKRGKEAIRKMETKK